MLFPVAALAAVSGVASAGAPTIFASKRDMSAFDWDTIKPTPQLVYHDCYDSFKCARLEVPLDWKNTTDSRRAAIAIIKLPAAVPANSSTFGGTIFANPGRPGGSGVASGLESSRLVQYIADKPGHRQYEVLWMDPRGIGYTTPTSQCYDSVLTRVGWNIAENAVGGINGYATGNLSRGTVEYKLALNKGFATHCADYEAEHGAAMAYVGTASVARDMVEIIDRVDEERKVAAGNNTSSCLGTNYDLDSRYAPNAKVPRIQYLGFSYGTAIGNYFASLFPGRVHRMVLDGILDAVDHSNGPGWLKDLEDTDKVFDEFWNGCFDAGEKVCKLANDTDPASAQAKFWSWVEGLDDKPYVYNDAQGNTNILTGDTVRQFAGSALYTPVQSFQTFSSVVHDAMARNKTALSTIFERAGNTKPSIQDATKKDAIAWEREVGSAVVCGDGEDVTDKDASWWMGYIETLTDQSRVLGRAWTSTRLICSSWPFRANWRFTGPFTSPPPDPSSKPGVPAAPILFLSNRLDPVTPLAAARRMSAGHAGSYVFVQDAIGHCALVSAQSTCTWAVVRDYMDTGKPPADDIKCKPECGPWDVGCSISLS